MQNEVTERHEKTDFWRPAYHFTPPHGWMNDPNGLIYFKGWYHLFYQYNPQNCYWGSMHWGHAVSRDLQHWEDRPIALYPDKPYDRCAQGGCFSGSAVEKDGCMYLFYTSSIQKNGRLCQTQSLCISEDGFHFEKYDGNPVIAEPPDGNSEDFRDPKVFFAEERWYMVLGGSVGGAWASDGDGRIYLYQSDDLYHWEYRGILLASEGKLGSMFECPDFFPLEGKWVLTCSPMNHPDYKQAIYCVGDMDFAQGKFLVEKTGVLDAGFDYYAPQSLADEQGDRILIAWMNEWQWMPWFPGGWGPTDEENWKGAFSFPRKVSFNEEGNLRLQPIETFWNLAKQRIAYEDLAVSVEKKNLTLPDPRCFAVRLRLNVDKIRSRSLELGLLSDGEKGIRLYVDLTAWILTLDLEQADGYKKGRIHVPLLAKDGEVELLLTMDHSLFELYVNSGEACASCNIFPSISQTGFWLRTPYRDAKIKCLEMWAIERALLQRGSSNIE